MENIVFGIELMVVGMSTVFCILLIVIFGGKMLIKAVNKFAPEEAAAPRKSGLASMPQAIDGTTMEVLKQVVTQLTGGKGHLASAKPINK